ncbi:MAG: PQQ-binding-like beta-propeller repeat protein [Planctomycetota bacterium]
MSKMGRLLDDDEVEFLLHGGRDAGASADEGGPSTPQGDQPAREVTMRGDLDKINLTDIFQTLAMSKLEGILEVRSTLDSREIHFRDGFVSVLVPVRSETLRLGQRLVRCGLLSADHLRSALLEQRKVRGHLGQILIDRGYVTQDDVDDVVHNQLQEDLFALFTWPQGTFCFYRGAVTDPTTIQRLEHAPQFEVNGVLLEVARRSDEWSRVMDAVGSLDEIVVATCESHEIPDDTGAAFRDILQAADGKATVRDLADLTLMPLFDCGLHVRELIDGGWLRKLDTTEVLDAVEGILSSGEPRRAAVALRPLLARAEDWGIETQQRIAQLVARSGEHRKAAEFLLAASVANEDPDVALLLANDARALERDSADVLERIADLLRRRNAPDPRELVDVLTDLCDARFEGGDPEAAAKILGELEPLCADPTRTLPRRARIAARLGDTKRAVQALRELAEIYRNRGDRERLVATYEQILKVDYTRRDVARALKNLHASKLARRTRFAAVAATASAVVFAAVVKLDGWRQSQQLDELRIELAEALEADELAEAHRIVAMATARFGAQPDVQLLEEDLKTREILLAAARERALEELRSEVQIQVTDLLATGQARAAIDAALTLADQGVTEDGVFRTIKNALTTVVLHLDTFRRELPNRLPEAPSLTQSPEVQGRNLVALLAELETPERSAVRGLLALRSDSTLLAALGPREHTTLFAKLDEANLVYREFEELRAAYESRLDRRSLALELTPLFHAAREHEKAYRFRAAYDAYRDLRDNHPEDDELRRQFAAKTERFATILRYLDGIEAATRRGDAGVAQAELRALQRQFPGLPFDVQLPVRVHTTPAGAEVFLDGTSLGTAPVLAAYRVLAEGTKLRVEHPGFLAEERALDGSDDGSIRFLLTREPDWIERRDAPVDRAPTTDSEGRGVFVTDRAGNVSRLDPSTGSVVWTTSTGDLSGLLTGAVPCADELVVFGSIDGPLRAVTQTDGHLAWTTPGLPTESTPIHVAGTVLVATDDGRLVAIEASTGTARFDLELAGAVRADLVACDEGRALVATENGVVSAIDVEAGRILWSTQVGRGLVAHPALGFGDAVVVAEDGTVTRLRIADGRVLWQADGFANLTLAPAVLADSVLVADGRDLHVLAGATGQRRRTLRTDADLRTPVRLAADVVLIGDAAGVVTAYGRDDLEPRFRLRAEGSALAPVVCLRDGSLIAAFQDRTLRAYRPISSPR